MPQRAPSNRASHAPVYEYAFRVACHARRAGADTPQHRHKLVKALRRLLAKAGYTSDLCEIRDTRRVRADADVTHLTINP